MSIIFNKNSLIIGCNYHTKWQSHKGMRFVLLEVKQDKAKLGTRFSHKEFWTDISDLIFIETDVNIKKAKSFLEGKMFFNPVTKTKYVKRENNVH